MTPRIGLHFAPPVLFGMMASNSNAQNNADPWKSDVDQIDPAKYYGAVAVHVMIGILPSAPPLMVKEVVLKGAYDRNGPFMHYPLLDILHERLGKKKRIHCVHTHPMRGPLSVCWQRQQGAINPTLQRVRRPASGYLSQPCQSSVK